jgi:hypothetical protein
MPVLLASFGPVPFEPRGAASKEATGAAIRSQQPAAA